ncbi:hypothetical protein KMZ68_13870 [Bradyrhizobium sediminis]|uniref:Uncharacterized protein n=1 Tax=Bradyrhizobium sediminis TaxID=2840469 RepID=A0A975NJB1_9BRAD|nr:hypothetical protein [Bradyrhizobium sediminis]QWG16132.1 hypothetical protein KMZ68_13870 [Bradyrhizobium sediminis]
MLPHLDKQIAAHERAARRYGLATGKQLLKRPGKYRWDLIDRDIRTLLARKRDLPAGRPGSIPQKVVDYMAGRYLSCAAIEGVPVSEPLLHLICQQLQVASFGIRGAAQKRDAIEEAREMFENDPAIADKEVARRVKVTPKAIRNWRKEGQLPARGGGDAES